MEHERPIGPITGDLPTEERANGKAIRPTDHPIEVDHSIETGGKARKRLKELERELTHLRVTEAKQFEQLKEVRARTIDVRTRIIALRATIHATDQAAGSAAANVGPIGYCMREKRPVQISDPQPVTLSNGRAAIAGSCSVCGARVMVLSGRSAAVSP